MFVVDDAASEPTRGGRASEEEPMSAWRAENMRLLYEDGMGCSEGVEEGGIAFFGEKKERPGGYVGHGFTRWRGARAS